MSVFISFMVAALLFFMVEIYTPTMFFLNFALAAIICGILGLFIGSYNILIPIFVILSILFVLFLRPILNINPKKNMDNNFDSQYVGKEATCITDVNAFSGRINIYDENWEARTTSEEAGELPKGTKVKIIRHDDLTMYVEKLTKKGK